MNLDNILSNHYVNKNYNEIFRYFLDNPNNNQGIWYLLYALFETGNFRGFSTLLNTYTKEISVLDDASRIWGYNGLIHYSRGKYIEAKDNLKFSIFIHGEYSEYANDWLKVLQLEKLKAIVHGNINYHFATGINKCDKDIFINKYNYAYERISSYFPVCFEKNIDVYIFDERKDSIGNRLSYANPDLLCIHVNINDEAGHEIAHILSCNAYDLQSPFIKEGMAEYFDDLKRSYAIDKGIFGLKISDLWMDYCLSDCGRLIGRIFISFLLELYQGEIYNISNILEADTFQQVSLLIPEFSKTVDDRIRSKLTELFKRNRKGNCVYINRDDLYKI